MDDQSFYHDSRTPQKYGYEKKGSVAGLRNLGHMALKSTQNLSEDINHEQPETGTEEAAKSFIHRYGQQLSLFARDSSLSFVPSETGKTFSFNPKKFEVSVPLDWFANEKYTEDELSFANHHEIAHFIDMRKNPEAYLKNFDQIEKDAEDLAKEYLQKYPDRTSQSQATEFFYRELHSLYNTLDDIYVNNVVFDRNHHFDYGDGRGSVKNLYEKIGFGEPDLTKQPLHRQMIYSLLRDEMLGDTRDETIIDEKVEDVLSKKKLGKNIREWVNFDLKPKQGILVDPAERYEVIRTLIQPEYVSLLQFSLDEQEKHNQNNRPENEESGESQEGEGSERSDDDQSNNEANENNKSQENSGEGDPKFNPFDNSPKPEDILDYGVDTEKTIRDILESFSESDKISEMSPEERAEYQNQKKMEEFDKEHHISREQRQENERIKNKIASARREMRKFWRGLIGKSIEYRQTTVPRQRKGRLNVDTFIDQYPELISSERKGDLRKLEIYDQKGLERRVVNQPETIDITLLVDCSGSMSSGSKIDSARTAAALLMYSVKDFNGELDATRHQTHSKLHANTEVIVFGSDYKTVKRFEKNHRKDSNDAEIITSISEINSKLGGTRDDFPLADIQSNITDDEKNRLRNGKLKKIVFEITDGASQNPRDTATYLRELENDEVIVIGFQIGDVSEQERSSFEEIWNSDRATAESNKKGIYIGKNVSELPGKLISALSESLNNIVI